MTSGRLQALGPGILYAATAVGTSHLVQSTRAGASYGLALAFLILLTFIAKYPAFRFGAQYSSATGQSLLHGYRRQGNWAIAIYIVIAIGTMFAAVPAVTLVTAALAKAAFGLESGEFAIAATVLAVCSAVLVAGGYRVLDRVVKVLMALLALSTLVATLLVLPQVDWATIALLPANVDPPDVFFIVALLGFMPSSVDLSVWHSLWSVAKAEDAKRRATLQEALGDFHVGYAGTFVLALCFVLLGAGVMHGAGVRFESAPAAFAGQLIDLYRQTLGDWSGPFIGAIAVAVMFSTVLAGLDGYPRAAVSMLHLYRQPDGAGPPPESDVKTYAVAVLALALGSLFILWFLVASLQVVVDVAATIMFLFAPVVAWLNHRVMKSPVIPEDARPGRGLLRLSGAGIAWLAAFSAYFLYLRFLA